MRQPHTSKRIAPSYPDGFKNIALQNGAALVACLNYIDGKYGGFMYDPLASNIVSLILAWLIVLPIVLAIAVGIVSLVAEFFSDRETSPRWLPWFGLYYLICLVVISPLRYLILQLLLIDSYVVQSLRAAASSVVAGVYVMGVLGLLYGLSIGLPNLVLVAVLKKETIGRAVVGVVLTPIAFAIGYALFFLALPYATWTIHWLPSKDVIRAANGPATVFYKLAVEPDIPRVGPRLEIEKGETANERLRSHVARTYVSDFKRSKQHFGDSLRFIGHANDVMNKQPEGLVVTIPPDDLKTIIADYKSSLKSAGKVDTDLLNEYVPDLGTMYRDKYIPGLTDEIKGMEDSEAMAAVRGQLALQQWGRWYNEHADAIWDAL